MTAEGASHATLMNAVYRRQRLIYDATRKYFLFGRDRLIEELAPDDGARVLEVACGTGRNLARIGRRYPGAALYGLDISSEMLISARAKLGDDARLAEADACAFDPGELFGTESFDRIVISYAVSMIPDWRGAVRQSLQHLAPGGELHIVDFGAQDGLPRLIKALLRRWLAAFHVAPRDDLEPTLARMADEMGLTSHSRPLYAGYSVLAAIRRPD
ncbi:MAG: class I SAM-dependent methyltransferase [Pseudomonadota bacterium]